jgi:homoisocitrate dehydrogenase
MKELQGVDGALFGCVATPTQQAVHYESPIVKLRRELDLFASVRPVLGGRVLIVREIVEDFYTSNAEQMAEDGKSATATRTISQRQSRRVAKLAFEMASQRASVRQEAKSLREMDGTADEASDSRTGARVTSLHKATILPLTDGIFLNATRRAARSWPNIVYDEMLVDEAVHDLILDSSHFDVIVAPNFYGDIMQDAGAGLSGGLDLVPTANIGDAFFLGHGSNLVSSAGVGAGGFASPIGHIRSAGMLLEHFGEVVAAQAVEEGVQRYLDSGDVEKAVSSDDIDKVIDRIIVEAQYCQHNIALAAGGS